MSNTPASVMYTSALIEEIYLHILKINLIKDPIINSSVLSIYTTIYPYIQTVDPL